MAREPARAGRGAAPVRRKERKNITSGVAHVLATFNNTIVTIADAQGNAIAWSSSGTQGFKGSRKSTPYAAQMAAEDAGKKAREHGMETLEIQVNGPAGAGPHSSGEPVCSGSAVWSLRRVPLSSAESTGVGSVVGDVGARSRGDGSGWVQAVSQIHMVFPSGGRTR